MAINPAWVKPSITRTGKTLWGISPSNPDHPERETERGGAFGTHLANVCVYFTNSARPDDSGRLGPSPLSRSLWKPSL